MLSVLVPIDAEDAMRKDLTAAQGDKPFCPVSATVPHDIEDRIPWATVERSGGLRTSEVVDTHYLVISAYAADDAEAQEYASMLYGIADELEHSDTASGIDWLAIDLTGLPLGDPDPQHPELSVVSFEIAATCRARAIEI